MAEEDELDDAMVGGNEPDFLADGGADVVDEDLSHAEPLDDNLNFSFGETPSFEE